MEFRDLKAQYKALKKEIDTAIFNVLESGQYIDGVEVKELEKELAEYVGVKHCITCANGTDALTISLAALGIGKDDIVLVPDFTFFASAESVAFVGATPVFVDVDEQTYNICPKKIEETILELQQKGYANQVKAIMTVDLFGLPADYPEIQKIADKYNLLIIEDAAQGFGGSINGQKACSFGDIATTSFFPAKPLGCYGDGGAIFTNDDELAAFIRSYVVHGKNGNDKYDNIRIGVNSRLDSIQATILRVKLKAFKNYELDTVNKVADKYNQELKSKGHQLPYIPQGYISSFAQYTIRFESKEARDNLQKEYANKNVPTMIYYNKPMHKQGAFKNKLIELDCFTGSQDLCDTVLSLPINLYEKL
ncbi:MULTISPECIES: DegT/DnrJ/EryC1/StrS family aminotransferase [unclassified Francisella]|uniref:DegT/DnrJ/EryC1/StrS family aminotransferase n=1 Tax=unclassified Francisella TaxID=2610885 RepID=UPI002E35EC82|nr:MULTISPECIES: DegT/DnrJ/EryC1/StrS family aminotransferase [unclassified Francisella]MED7818616.1 DegT/DnrJ/EryC1/StrS family aminotransferase [Francisella sp. 19S2-4]MED7829452.1 DegT/DnrJ/EryC1/StrS family aminotransferase [Francisella sp. 19S2-10]